MIKQNRQKPRRNGADQGKMGTIPRLSQKMEPTKVRCQLLHVILVLTKESPIQASTGRALTANPRVSSLL